MSVSEQLIPQQRKHERGVAERSEVGVNFGLECKRPAVRLGAVARGNHYAVCGVRASVITLLRRSQEGCLSVAKTG